MSASNLLEQWHRLVDFARQPDAMTVSADVSAWSMSQHRVFWDVLHRCLGGTAGLSPSYWLDCLNDTAFLVGSGRSQKLVVIHDGTYKVLPSSLTASRTMRYGGLSWQSSIVRG
eukprot:1235451-Amphidinium_carterae.1